MSRSVLALGAALTLSACMTPQQSPVAALSDSRVTFPSPDPEGGPIIVEYYGDGTAMLVFNEVAERGQTPMTWRVDGTDLCVAPTAAPLREDCSEFKLRGGTLSMGRGGTMVGTVVPL